MTCSIQEITAKHAQLTEPMPQKVFDFVEFILANRR